MVVLIKKDLRKYLGKIKDQGNRPTCMAFTATDCHSFARNGKLDLSVEYAFFNAVQKTTAKDRTSGVSFKNMSESISVNGQPLESDWAYIENLSVTDEWKIPYTIKKCFHRDSNVTKSNIDAICNNLNNDLPVILVIDISMSFFHLIDDSVLNASANEPKRGTHAILAVGYGETNKGKCILIRNSWGIHWGNSGYGWIHEDYLIPRLHISAVMN